VERLTVAHEGTPIPISASLGVAPFRSGESLESLVDRADRAMYRAKVSGRNRVVMAEDAAGASVHSDGAPASVRVAALG
jgi:diguanylate cyclase (GGDEF)-like protein